MGAASVSIGDVIAGKYIVERVIGEGGMGIVLAARHRELEQRVAIKFLLPEIAEQGMAAERFRREARSAARMRGAHVCRVLDVGTLETGVPYMVMEYLEGHDLATELERRGHLPPEEAVSYLLQACEALAEAHAAGIIHRDLKPANLFLEQCADGSRRVKVLDFGVSKSLIDAATPGLGALTKTSNLVGSPLYMSPEQLDSARDVDARTDVWSLGVVLFELLAGRTPFRGESIPQLVTAVLHEQPRGLATEESGIPAELEAVVQRALEKTRVARYGSVAELAHALIPFAAPQDVGAASRVSRLLSVAEPVGLHSSGAAASPARATPTGNTPGRRAEPAAASTPARTPNGLGSESTPLSWSRTTRQRNVRVGLGLLALVVLALGIGGYFMTRSSSAPTPAAAASSPIDVQVPSSPAPSEAPTPVPPPAVAPAAAPAPAEAPAAEAAKAEAIEPPGTAPTAAPEPPKAAAAEVTPEPVRPEAPRPREAERRREPERAKIQAPTPSSSNVSDFGGRR